MMFSHAPMARLTHQNISRGKDIVTWPAATPLALGNTMLDADGGFQISG
jgi:hypothetical protein